MPKTKTLVYAGIGVAGAYVLYRAYQWWQTRKAFAAIESTPAGRAAVNMGAAGPMFFMGGA